MKASTTRVLQHLQAAGGRGMVTGELASSCGPRYGARLGELDHLGYVITRRRESPVSTRYRLLGGPQRVRRYQHLEALDAYLCRTCGRSTLGRRECCGEPAVVCVLMQARTDHQEAAVAA